MYLKVEGKGSIVPICQSRLKFNRSVLIHNREYIIRVGDDDA